MATDAEVMAKAVRNLAKETKATRRKQYGQRSESSDEDEDQGSRDVDIQACLKKYGLQKVDIERLPKIKDMEEAAKRVKRHYKKGKSSIVEGNLLAYLALSAQQDARRRREKILTLAMLSGCQLGGFVPLPSLLHKPRGGKKAPVPGSLGGISLS